MISWKNGSTFWGIFGQYIFLLSHFLAERWLRKVTLISVHPNMKLEPRDASLGDMLAWLFMFKKESHILHKTRTVVVFIHLWNTLLTVIKLILNICLLQQRLSAMLMHCGMWVCVFYWVVVLWCWKLYILITQYIYSKELKVSNSYKLCVQHISLTLFMGTVLAKQSCPFWIKIQ